MSPVWVFPLSEGTLLLHFGISSRIFGIGEDPGAGFDTLISIENLRGSRFDDILTGNGNSMLEGGAGADELIGSLNDNANILSGGFGSNSSIGDVLTGAGGADTFVFYGGL